MDQWHKELSHSKPTLQPVTAPISNCLAKVADSKAESSLVCYQFPVQSAFFFLSQVKLGFTKLLNLEGVKKTNKQQTKTQINMQKGCTREKKANHRTPKFSLECLRLWLMGNMLLGNLCRSWDACSHDRLVNSKHGAAASCSLFGALAHGPPSVREPGQPMDI